MDLSTPNTAPGRCEKCRGSGLYRWGATINGRPQHSGHCNACRGTGVQTRADILRNRTFNYYQLQRMCGQ